MKNALGDIRGFTLCSSTRMLAALLFILLCMQSAHSQTCTDGFRYDRRSRQCMDVDECRTLPDPCRGDMRCVNQNGGYLCLPRGLYNQPYGPEPPQVQQQPESAYQGGGGGGGGAGAGTGTSASQPNSFVPALPRSGEPSYPQVGYTVPCILGYALADDGTCNVFFHQI
ncbi:fibulin-5-like [Hippocampus comes]|uniref:fibulin-5-like n=1 Tax=Hippocampus comes TaxID=109280 RepID=UPI00094F23E2|nr:PREDICTED: fibulin-5-like [Hippocampus comes]